MKACIDSFVGSKEGRFECEAVNKLELFPHDDTSCRLAALLHHERAVLEAEHIDVLAE